MAKSVIEFVISDDIVKLENRVGKRGVEVVISAKLPDNIFAHSSTFRLWDLSRRGGRGAPGGESGNV
jgi:hypothetical protein